jgi:hypothetical protein
VAPGRIVDTANAPPRGRFVLWADEFHRFPRFDVRQGGRALADFRGVQPMVANRPYEITADWLPRALAGGPDVTISVR